MIRAIEHIAIAAQDTAALARWYRDTLGFRLVVEGDPLADLGLLADPDRDLLVIMKDGRLVKNRL